MEYQNGSDQGVNITKQNNSNIHFKRKSDNQIRRDKARAEQHKKTRHEKITTRSMAKDSSSDSKELPRFNLVDSAMHGEKQSDHMQYTHDISAVYSPGASETSMITGTEHSLVMPELHDESVETGSSETEHYGDNIDMPDLKGIARDDMNAYYVLILKVYCV